MNAEQKKEVDERFDKEFKNYKSWNVEIGKTIYGGKIKDFIHSELERAEKEGLLSGIKQATITNKEILKQARIEGIKEYMDFLIEHHRVKVIGETLYVMVSDMKTLYAEMEKEKSQ